jgi:broad specificity phosphatase PhoE
MDAQEIWWIRHGPTRSKGMVGWSDLPADLSDEAAIARLEGALPKDAPVISSDLIRAVTTADAIQGDRIRLPHDPDLREMSFGDWELRTHADIEAEDPERIRAFWDDPGSVRPPGGESWSDLSARVDAATARLLNQHARLIIVAHFGTILSQVQKIGALGENAFGQRIENLSLTQIRYTPTPEIIRVNHAP